MTEISISHFFADHLYAKQVKIRQGETIQKHKHTFTHLSILASGSINLVRDGLKTWHHAPECFEIEAGVAHEITAITDCVWYCIHATDEKDESKIDRILVGG